MIPGPKATPKHTKILPPINATAYLKSRQGSITANNFQNPILTNQAFAFAKAFLFYRSAICRTAPIAYFVLRLMKTNNMSTPHRLFDCLEQLLKEQPAAPMLVAKEA